MTDSETAKLARIVARGFETLADPIRETNERVKSLETQQAAANEKLAVTNEKLAVTNDGLDTLEQHLTSEIVEVAKAVVEVRNALRERKLDRAVLADHEKRLRAVERKIA